MEGEQSLLHTLLHYPDSMRIPGWGKAASVVHRRGVKITLLQLEMQCCRIVKLHSSSMGKKTAAVSVKHPFSRGNLMRWICGFNTGRNGIFSGEISGVPQSSQAIQKVSPVCGKLTAICEVEPTLNYKVRTLLTALWAFIQL